MSGITVLVASRERPAQALATLRSFEVTKVLPNTKIYFGIDYDEPKLSAYRDLIPAELLYTASREGSGSLTKVTNEMARTFPDYIMGSVGDDHRFRTPNWDGSVSLGLLGKPGVAYGDDLFMREKLPTAAFMSGQIVRELGWFCLPTLDHMYVDNVWRDIGYELGSLHYLGNVVIEHLHFSAGKSIMDQSYRRTNSSAQYEKDRLAYEVWRSGQMAKDIERIKNASS